MRRFLLLYIMMSAFALCSFGQEEQQEQEPTEKIYKQMYIVSGGDTIPVFHLPTAHVFAIKKFKNNKERQAYTKLIRDVKKAYPYARAIASSIIETYEYMQTLPDEKARQKHMEEVQKYLMDRYKPEMKKMTKTQGKILIKLVDRECGTSSYEIVKALLGSFKAGFYNIFAGLFGNSLKSRYDPDGEDADIEAIVVQIEQGTIDYYYSVNYHGFGKY